MGRDVGGHGGDARMITLYGFGRIFPEAHGETKDLRVQWALEEIELPYRVHALDHTRGELSDAAFRRLSPFHQAPVIEDEGVVVAESAAILLYLAEKAGKLVPEDAAARTHVTQWCFAAVSTIEPTFTCLDLIDIFDTREDAQQLTDDVRRIASRWLAHLDRHLQGREWIADSQFTVADILMTCVLRTIRKSDLMDPYPEVRNYYLRSQARPAWQRTLKLYAQRLGTSIENVH